MYYGSLKNVNYPKDLSKEISGRLSNVHKISKIKMKNENSLTGKYLTGKLNIPVPKKRRPGNKLYLEVR